MLDFFILRENRKFKLQKSIFFLDFSDSNTEELDRLFWIDMAYIILLLWIDVAYIILQVITQEFGSLQSQKQYGGKVNVRI